jgi:hypothetical protein
LTCDKLWLIRRNFQINHAAGCTQAAHHLFHESTKKLAGQAGNFQRQGIAGGKKYPKRKAGKKA